jgi:hypothetical protein
VEGLAAGRTAEGEHWRLVTEAQPLGRYLGVEVTSAEGKPFWGTGCLLPGGPPGGAADLTVGGDDEGPVTLVLHLRPDVRAAVVHLSDGTREDLRVHPLPGRADRAATLVHPRRLDVHRIDLYDADGGRFPDPAPELVPPS